MTLSKLIRCFALTAVLGLTPAFANSLSTLTWTGVCGDCAGNANATLVLQNYTIGDSFSDPSLFVSLDYSSSLVPSFEVTPQTLITFNGQFQVIGGGLSGYVNIGDSNLTFETSGGVPGAAWSLNQGVGGKDFGYSNTWTVVSSDTPEPSTFGLGLLGIGALVSVVWAKLAKTQLDC